MNDLKKEKLRKLWILFVTMLGISATTNGGYAIVAVMRDKFENKYHWLEENELLDLSSIAQSVPGPIAVNGAVLVGYRIGGFPGALAAMAGTILPPLVIMILVCSFYTVICSNETVRYFMKGMQAGVVALLASVTIDLFRKTQKEKNIFSLVIITAVFAAAWFTDMNKFVIALLCAGAGVIKTAVTIKSAGKGE